MARERPRLPTVEESLEEAHDGWVVELAQDVDLVLQRLQLVGRQHADGDRLEREDLGRADALACLHHTEGALAQDRRAGRVVLARERRDVMIVLRSDRAKVNVRAKVALGLRATAMGRSG